TMGWNVVVAAKENTNMIPSALRDFASEDLPLNMARTYYDGQLTLQAVHVEDHVTCVLSTAAVVKGLDVSALPPLFGYEVAVAMFRNAETSNASIIKAYACRSHGA